MSVIPGTPGHDVLRGTTGHDLIFGGSGDDTIFGNDGNDTIYGGDGSDYIHCGRGVDNIYAGNSDNYIFIDDTFDFYNRAGDNIDGGEGLDAIIVQSNTTTGSILSIKLGEVKNVEILYNDSYKSLVIEGAGLIDVSSIHWYASARGADDFSSPGHISGSALNDTIKGFNFANHNDTILGGNGNDLIYGYAGNDFLMGDAGNDTLVGGAGDDQLRGGSGNDTFQFDYRYIEGQDVIHDFASGEDVIHVTNTRGLLNFDNLIITDNANGCSFAIHSGTLVQLNGITADSLSASDFLFT